MLALVFVMLADPGGTNTVTSRIIGCAVRVHSAIGPGVDEEVYKECLEYELPHNGFEFESQRTIPITYRGVLLKSRYYVDLVAEDLVVVEVKAVSSLAEIHVRQVVTYLASC